MSYLNPLRLHFAGRFQANVSTVNNDPSHYDNSSFLPQYQQLEGDEPNGWFNPEGDAAWRLLGCQITSAWTSAGAVTGDPVLSYIIADSDTQAPAKLVDLDPQQQLVSTVWGLQVRIADSNGNTLLRAAFEPAAFIDIWNRSTASSEGDTSAGAMYQSVLKDLQWSDVSSSPFLSALKSAASNGLLSIKFNVDSFNLSYDSPDFMTGRIVGTIGPATASEPKHMVRGRQFMAENGGGRGFFNPEGNINFCVAVVDEGASCIYLDLGNALLTGQNDTIVNHGDLTLNVNGASLSQPMTIPTSDYTAPNWYADTAGVVVLPIAAGDMQLVKQHPLVLSSSDGSQISEWPSGAFVRADTFVYRMSPGDSVNIPIYATQFGQPLTNADIKFVPDSSQLQAIHVARPASALTFSSSAITDSTGCAMLSVTASDPGSPRNFRGDHYGIDGQVYGVRAEFANTGLFGDSPINQWNFLSFLVWSAFAPQVPGAPTWYDDLQPIFQQNANLYPVMNRFLDLGNYDDVVAHAGLLKLAFGLDISDPNSMPVTRDLSPAKRSAILTWLDNPIEGTPPAPLAVPLAPKARAKRLAFQRDTSRAKPKRLSQQDTSGARAKRLAFQLDTPGSVASVANKGGKAAAAAQRLILKNIARPDETLVLGKKPRVRLKRSMLAGLQSDSPNTQDVIDSLQQAVELEHATIPAYLYALYSLDPSKNAEVIDIIQSVVIEEMLHMILASNVLNALGGDSQIDNPAFIPDYPGPLPGGVASDLTVHLAPFSMAQLQVFLQIEQPEDPLEFQSANLLDEGGITIGQFYQAISDAIGLLGDGAFSSSPRNQVGPDLMPDSVVVTDVASAQEAIGIIIEQGEGSSTSPEEGVGNQVAHYYRFMQIYKGALLVPASGQTPPWAYIGDPVDFEDGDAYAVPTDPNYPTRYPAGSAQAFANDNFNYTYTSLLSSIDALCSGQNNQAQMNRAIGLMMSLKGQAKAMMAGIPDASVLTGPSFQYQPVNPAG